MAGHVASNTALNMDHLNRDGSSTPPHHPTAGVHILRQEIEAIATHGFPNSTIESIKQISRGKSYNNRIYFVELSHPPITTQFLSDTRLEQVVLKVNGRFFGGNKIQNEVACLQLLQRHCPDAPSPRPLAWSEDGQAATFATEYRAGDCIMEAPLGVEGIAHGGWILMSQVPGRPMPVDELDDETLRSLGRELGDLVARMRQDASAQERCGNIRLPLPDLRDPNLNGQSIKIRDIIQEGICTSEVITSPNQYYAIKLTDKLEQLESADTLAPKRSVCPALRYFLSDALPHLDLNVTLAGKFVFTHYDLSPRNVLISQQPHHITGLLDFEFSGFFPPTEEFLNDAVHNPGEWPRAFCDAYLERLHERGIETPVRGFDSSVWNRCLWLERLISNVAPWYLPGDLKGDELDTELLQAKNCVREMLSNLDSLE